MCIYIVKNKVKRRGAQHEGRGEGGEGVNKKEKKKGLFLSAEGWFLRSEGKGEKIMDVYCIWASTV